VMAHRGVEDHETEPIVCAGIQTAPYSDEETQLLVYELCARDRCVDGIWGGLVTRVGGRYDVVAGTPGEILQYRGEAARLRQAVARAGRPGMFVTNNAPSSIATIAMADREMGLRPTDPFESTGISEMKIAYDDLNRTAFALSYGALPRGSMNSVIGGFSGGPDGAAIVGVAGAFQLLMVNLARSMRPGAVSFAAKSRATRDQLWVTGVALQALSRNTHLILDGCMGDHPAAGPGTHQYFWESAAGFITSTVCGGHSMGGTRKFVVSNVVNYGSPLESRWMGEVVKSAASLSRETANRIVNCLLEKYQGYIKTAPAGFTLWDLYDRERLEPTDSYKAVYQEAREELARLGFQWRSWD
jgi:methylamine--corrinoid protein Co-methyltransferase